MPQIEKPYSNPLDDGRRKILPSQYAEVKRIYNELKSYQKTADHFGVSKRLIIFIVRPKTLKALQDHNKQNEHWRRYYSTEKRREYMRTYRAKKRSLGLMTSKPKKKI